MALRLQLKYVMIYKRFLLLFHFAATISTKEVFFLNTTQLECFLAVVNFLNFSRAAEALSISQPAVSHQISTLEDELGVKLFHRTSKSVRLTQAGYQFIPYADDILKLEGLSRARLKASQEFLPLTLSIGCRNFMELRMLQPVLAQLGKEEPQLLPLLRLIPFDSLENLLKEGDIQVMFSYEEVAPQKAVYRELLQRPVICLCKEDHPLAAYDQLSVEQLHQGAGRMAVCRAPIFPPALVAAQNQVTAGYLPGQVIFCDNLETVFTLVEAGLACTLLADLPTVRMPGLRYLPVSQVAPLSFGTVTLPGEARPVVRRFLTLLRESLAGA